VFSKEINVEHIVVFKRLIWEREMDDELNYYYL